MQRQVDIIRRHIVILVRQSVHVYEVTAGGTDLHCRFIHHLHEGVNGAGRGLRDSHRGIISGRQQHTIEKLLDGEGLARMDIGHGGSGNRDFRVLRDRELLLQVVDMPEAHEGRHHLRDGCRVGADIRILRDEHLWIVALVRDEKVCLCCEAVCPDRLLRIWKRESLREAICVLPGDVADADRIHAGESHADVIAVLQLLSPAAGERYHKKQA